MKIFFKRLLIITLGLIPASILYWTIPYGQVEMLSKPFVLKWLFTTILVGVIGVLLMKEKPIYVSLMTTTGFLLSITLRLIYDSILLGPESHNLWPIEVFITILIAFPASLISAIVTNYVITFLKK